MATYFVDGAKTTTLTFTGNQTIPIRTILIGDTSGSKLFVTGGITDEDEVTGWADGAFFNGEGINSSAYTLTGIMMGAEKVTNGDFALGDQDWTKGDDWTIEDSVGRATDASYENLEQNITGLTIGRKYKVTYTIENYSNGYVGLYFPVYERTDWANIIGATVDVTATATSADLKFFAGAGATLDIDDVSVKEYTVHGESGVCDGSTWEDAFEGPYGFQEIIDDVGAVSFDDIFVRNTFDMEKYGSAIVMDSCAGVAIGGYVFALDIIGVDSTGTGTNTGNRLPVGSYVKFDGGGTLADSIWHMSALCEHIRIHNIELTGTDGLLVSSYSSGSRQLGNSALLGNGWTENRYGFLFVNCKFADAYYIVDMSEGESSYYPRNVAFLFCEFETNTGNGTYLIYMRVAQTVYFKCCKFTNPNGTSSGYMMYSSTASIIHDGCIMDGGGGADYFCNLGGYVNVFQNNFFTDFIQGLTYHSNVDVVFIENNNICEMGDTVGSDRPFYIAGGIHFSNYSVSNSDSASHTTLVDIQTYLGDKLSMKESNTAFTIGFNDSYELCAPSAILEGGIPDIYGRPTMRGPAQVDPRQKQGILE